MSSYNVSTPGPATTGHAAGGEEETALRPTERLRPAVSNSEPFGVMQALRVGIDRETSNPTSAQMTHERRWSPFSQP